MNGLLQVSIVGRPSLSATSELLSLLARAPESTASLLATVGDRSTTLSLQPPQAILATSDSRMEGLSVEPVSLRLDATVPASSTGGGGGGQTLAEILAAAGITPVADGTYVTGLGVSQDGTITLKSGIVTAVQPALA